MSAPPLTARRWGFTQWKNLLLIIAAVVIINVPPAYSAYRSHRLSASGVDVDVRASHRTIEDRYFLSFTVPDDAVERGDRSFSATAQVDRRAYDAAVAAGTVRVRVLPGSSTVWRVDGQVTSRLGLWLTLGADLVLALLVLAYVRLGSRLRPTLVLLAERDLEPGADGDPGVDVLDRIEGQRYAVSGRVEEIEADAVLLRVGDRRVRVELDGHHNPAAPHQPVRATGTMIA